MKNFGSTSVASVNHRGFTLIELMLVVVITAVILGIAAPNMVQFAKNHRLTGAANDLLAAIHVARAEAVKRQIPTAMCFTTNADPSSGEPDCNGDGTQGWVTWVDTDSDSQVDAGETVLVRHEALHSSVSLAPKPASTSKFVAYGANGFSRTVANSLTGIVICDSRKNIHESGSTSPSAARGLIVSPTGRPTITRSVDVIAADPNLLASASSGTCVP